jgi:hypothetical protein
MLSPSQWATRDLGVAALLVSNKCECLAVALADRPDRAEFVFRRTPELSSVLSSLASGTLPLNTPETARFRRDLRVRAIAAVESARSTQ